MQLNKIYKEKSSSRIFSVEDNLILVNQTQLNILSSAYGKIIKKVDFGEAGCDIKTLNIVNKSI